MDNITLGKYLPLDSIVYHMDPRAKIGAMLIMMTAIFIPTGYAGYGVIAAAVTGTALLACLKLSFLWRAMKPMLFTLTFLLIINLLVIRDGDVLFIIFGFFVYTGAIAQTLYIVVRLALMIMTTTILTVITKPLELTLEIEDLLKPFQVTHIPAHEIVAMVSIALRFIPMLVEETQRIMKAQASRGVDVEEGGPMEKVKAILSLIVPLFVPAFQRVEDLAYATEVRGYIPNRMRTRHKQLKMEGRDYVLLIVSALVFTAMVVIVLYAQIQGNTQL